MQIHYVPQENPWADFGRAYFHPYQSDSERFEVNLYTVDEMRRQIEAYESNMSFTQRFDVISDLDSVCEYGLALEEPFYPFDDCCSSLQCLKELVIGITSYENVISHWSDGCRAAVPYIKYPSLHCLALCGERQSPEAVAASSRRCRSFLAAQADEKPNEDLLGH